MDCILTIWASASFWEGVEYFSEAIVITAAVIELLCDFEHILKGEDKKALRRRVEKWAATVLVAGLGIELGSLVRTNQLFDVEIGAANGRAIEAIRRADREAKARVEIETRLVELGPRANLLNGKNRETLISATKAFAPQKAEIWYCATSFNNFFVDQDTMSVATLMRVILGDKGAHWSLPPLAQANCTGTGISIRVGTKASESTKKAAQALLAALTALPLVVIGPAVEVSDVKRAPQPRVFDQNLKRELFFPPLGTDTIVVTVLSHP